MTQYGTRLKFSTQRKLVLQVRIERTAHFRSQFYRLFHFVQRIRLSYSGLEYLGVFLFIRQNETTDQNWQRKCAVRSIRTCKTSFRWVEKFQTCAVLSQKNPISAIHVIQYNGTGRWHFEWVSVNTVVLLYVPTVMS